MYHRRRRTIPTMDRVGVISEDRRGSSEIFVGNFLSEFFISLPYLEMYHQQMYRRWIGEVLYVKTGEDRRKIFVGKFSSEIFRIFSTPRWTLDGDLSQVKMGEDRRKILVGNFIIRLSAILFYSKKLHPLKQINAYGDKIGSRMERRGPSENFWSENFRRKFFASLVPQDGPSMAICRR